MISEDVFVNMTWKEIGKITNNEFKIIGSPDSPIIISDMNDNLFCIVENKEELYEILKEKRPYYLTQEN